MDIVLECFDTFVFDHLYAALLPAASPPPSYLEYGAGQHNASQSGRQQWHYTPATRYLSFTPREAAYMSAWNRDNIYRQAVSLFLITWIFGLIIYFVCSTVSFYTVYDRSLLDHPRILKNQIRKEIAQASSAMPVMAVCTVPFFLLEIHGYTKMYDSPDEGPGTWYTWAQFPLFLCFTDFCIYWIHRGLHHPLVYKQLHKPHHKWIVPTPYASYAFHPLDGFAQSLPYHVFPFLFPLQKAVYVALFALVNIWTILIHDGEVAADNEVINGAAHHTMHHLYFNYNYGQYTTLWDRVGGSYRKPEPFQQESKPQPVEANGVTVEAKKDL